MSNLESLDPAGDIQELFVSPPWSNQRQSHRKPIDFRCRCGHLWKPCQASNARERKEVSAPLIDGVASDPCLKRRNPRL